MNDHRWIIGLWVGKNVTLYLRECNGATSFHFERWAATRMNLAAAQTALTRLKEAGIDAWRQAEMGAACVSDTPPAMPQIDGKHVHIHLHLTGLGLTER